jgi:hypothetical protein
MSVTALWTATSWLCLIVFVRFSLFAIGIMNPVMMAERIVWFDEKT